MTWGDDFYSRLVAWMKIILPLIALALLSTLFLISRQVDPTQQPIVQIDLEQRAQDQGATRPAFAGVTTGGDEVSFHAESARPDPRDAERLVAQAISAELRLEQGNVIEISASTADMHQRRYTASLKDAVHLRTADGYEIDTDQLDMRYDTLFAETPGPVRGSGPPGEIEAGRMVLSTVETTGVTELRFTQGVKLVYTPNNAEE